MKHTLIKLDLNSITDWNSFHESFAQTFGFPGFYGRNMNAWNDCMSCLDDPDAGLSAIHTAKGSVVVLHLEGVTEFRSRCPEQFADLIECSAFVNWRRVERGEDPILALSFYA